MQAVVDWANCLQTAFNDQKGVLLVGQAAGDFGSFSTWGLDGLAANVPTSLSLAHGQRPIFPSVRG